MLPYPLFWVEACAFVSELEVEGDFAGGICAVEWSENVEDAFDGSEIRVTIRKTGDNSREITIEGVELC